MLSELALRKNEAEHFRGLPGVYNVASKMMWFLNNELGLGAEKSEAHVKFGNFQICGPRIVMTRTDAQSRLDITFMFISNSVVHMHSIFYLVMPYNLYDVLNILVKQI